MLTLKNIRLNIYKITCPLKYQSKYNTEYYVCSDIFVDI